MEGHAAAAKPRGISQVKELSVVRNLVSTKLVGALVAKGVSPVFEQTYLKVDDSEVQMHGSIQQGFAVSNNNNFLTMDTSDGTGAMTEVGLRILSHQPEPPSRVRPELPAAFDAWMKKARAKKREERFASAAELAEALLEVSRAPLQREHAWPRRQVNHHHGNLDDTSPHDAVRR